MGKTVQDWPLASSTMAAVVKVLCVLIFIYVHLIRNSEQMCRMLGKDENYYHCDSLSDVLQAVKHVRLELNKSSVIGTFKQTPKEYASIERLEIHSSINNIDTGAFRNFVNIQHLTLVKNDLNTIKPGMFTTTSLTRLYMEDDNITAVLPGSFDQLPALGKLYIIKNNLTKIQKNTFSKLSVITLSLSKNQIHEIEDNAFESMPNLENLYLDGNLLTEFKEKLSYPQALKKLWLQKNRLTEVTSYTMEGLVNLEVLNLGFNRISRIEPGAFRDTTELSILVLTHNWLKFLDGNVLPSRGLKELKQLYLDHNRIMFLSSKFLLRLPNLRKATIGGNPWTCQCLDSVLKWLSGVSLKCDEDYFNGKRPVCVVPTDDNVCEYAYDDRYYRMFEEHERRSGSAPVCWP